MWHEQQQQHLALVTLWEAFSHDVDWDMWSTESKCLVCIYSQKRGHLQKIPHLKEWTSCLEFLFCFLAIALWASSLCKVKVTPETPSISKKEGQTRIPPTKGLHLLATADNLDRNASTRRRHLKLGTQLTTTDAGRHKTCRCPWCVGVG